MKQRNPHCTQPDSRAATTTAGILQHPLRIRGPHWLPGGQIYQEPERHNFLNINVLSLVTAFQCLWYGTVSFITRLLDYGFSSVK